jgi:hypothetical protein
LELCDIFNRKETFWEGERNGKNNDILPLKTTCVTSTALILILKFINKGNDQSSEIKSEVRQVLDYIITEVCNEVEIDNPSKTRRVNFSHREKY